MSDGGEDVLKPARDEVFRKLGRSIVLFQHLEARLKHLIASSELRGSNEEELRTDRDSRAERVQKRMLGELVGRYCDEVIGPAPTHAADAEPQATVTIRTRFRVERDEYVQAKAKALGELVGQRNELVHCLIGRFDLRDGDALRALDARLDAIAVQVRSEIEELDGMVREHQAMSAKVASLLASTEGRALLEVGFLQTSRLVTLMLGISAEIARPDGWADLSKAAAIVDKEAPEELAELKPRYGHTSLKRALLASDFFDVSEEQTARGGVRVLFRARQAV